jgi:hypothetical protein
VFADIPGMNARVTDVSDDNASVLWNVEGGNVIGSGVITLSHSTFRNKPDASFAPTVSIFHHFPHLYLM